MPNNKKNILIEDEGSHPHLAGAIVYIAQFIKANIKLNIDEIEAFYVKITNKGKLEMSYIFETFDLNKIDYKFKLVNSSCVDKVNYGKLFLNNDYRNIFSKIKFNKELYTDILNIKDNTLGVHFRTTDNNVCHNAKTPVYYKDYKKKIDEIIKNKKIDKIFVASDNKESISKLKKDFNLEILSYNNQTIRDFENSIEQRFGDSFYNTRLNYIESFKDIITLSKCHFLLFTYSNFPNLAILLSENNLEKNYIKI